MSKKDLCFSNFLLNASPRQKEDYYAVVNPKGFEAAPTYKELADYLDMSLGTLYTHLKRIRDNYPLTYKQMMTYRQKQLAKRHELALKKAKDHTTKWFKKKRARAYKEKFGCYPWEAQLYSK